MVIGDPESDDGSVACVETRKREWSDRNASVYGENKAKLLQRIAAVDCDYYELVTFIAFLTIWWHLLAALLIGVVFGFVCMQLDLDD
ncbi:hypothetical protein GQ600_5525 [Phytophthora cactorum]|nr:hypothetical protein GQ600_5525 [Phytophthora cactorum]